MSTSDEDTTPPRAWLPGTTIRFSRRVRPTLDRFAATQRWSLNVAVDVLVTEALTARGIEIPDPDRQEGRT